MANSFVRYTGNGSTDAYAVPFSYRAQADVSVTIDGVATSAYTWNGAGTVITFTSPPADTTNIEIRRTTSQAARLVDYADGSVLKENDLDTDSFQGFYMGQEAIDDANDRILLDAADFQWDAQSKRIKNVADPTAAQDAATKNYLESTWLSTADKANITTLAGISGLSTLAANSANVTTVATAIANVNIVAGISANVTTVAGISANVTTVAGIDSDVTAVAGDATDIGAVAAKATEIGRLGTADAVADLALLGTSAVVTDLDLLATAGNVTAMGLLGNSTTVANMALLGTADAVSDMNTLATAPIVADLAMLAETDIVADLAQLATTDFVSDLNAIEAVKADVTTVADNLAGVTSFAERYRVGTTNPASSLDEGDLFYNSTDNALKYYNGTGWASITAGIGSLADDTTPELGGDLSLNGNNIDFPTTANISDCLDEDTMSSDSATKLATQQSIKAYVDNASGKTELYGFKKTNGTGSQLEDLIMTYTNGADDISVANNDGTQSDLYDESIIANQGLTFSVASNGNLTVTV